MSKRTRYNERYSFEDPTNSASRTTMYREKRQKAEMNCSLDSETLHIEDDLSSSPAAPILGESIEKRGSDSSDVDIDNVLEDADNEYEIEDLDMDGASDVNEEGEDDIDEHDSTFPNENHLYEGSRLTVSASCVLLMQLKLKHKLTNECVQDFLQLIELHCPSPNNCVTSTYKLNKELEKKQNECSWQIKEHYFCSYCFQATDDSQSENSSSMCENPQCKKDLTEVGSKSSFIEVPIEPQLQTLFSRKCIYSPFTARLSSELKIKKVMYMYVL